MESRKVSIAERPIEYHDALRPQSNRPFRSIAAISAITGSMAASIALIAPTTKLLDKLLLPEDHGFSKWTPGLLLASNILSAIQIPASMLIEHYVYKQPSNTISSSENRFRWYWLAHLAKYVVPTTLAFRGLTLFIHPVSPPKLTYETIATSLAIAAAMPLASIAEEYIVRGLLQRVTGSCFSNPDKSFWMATTITSIFFAGIHVSKSPWMNAYCLLSGVCACLMTRWTGGLEASSLLHATSNVVLMLPYAMAGNLGELEELTVTGPSLGVAALVSANVLVCTWLVRQQVMERDGTRMKA